jgi:hypothetical protein
MKVANSSGNGTQPLRLSDLYGSPWLYLREWHNMVLGANWSRRFPKPMMSRSETL